MKHLQLYEKFDNDKDWLASFEAFLDHPWQEDAEIEIVSQLSQHRAQFSKGWPAAVKDYFMRWSKDNEASVDGMVQSLSDKFMTDYENLRGVNESEKKDKPKKKLMKDMSSDEKVAFYRSKISAERRKSAPDQATIEDLKAKASKAGAKKDKPKK